MPSNPSSTFLKDLKQLTKMGLSLSVVFSSVAGYFMAADTVIFMDIVLLSVGGYLLVGGSNAFNQLIEIKTDALMERTQNRPLPTGRMKPATAFIIASIFTILGIFTLYQLAPKCALFGAISIFLYTCVYTPLKPITPLSIFVGAIPGAIPFMLGWVAVTNKFSIEPGMLFLIQFFWQFPHFWAIAWLQYDAYKKAGFNLMPMGKKDKRATVLIILYTICLLIVSVIPVFKLTGDFYIKPVTAILVAIMGGGMLYYAIKLYKGQANKQARQLMLSSVFYITFVQIVYIIDKFLH